MNTAVAQTATDKAGFWIRVLAYIIDAVILFVVDFIVQLLLHSVPSLAELIEVVIGIGYFAILWSATGGGQTVGMRVTHIRVIGTDGSQISIGRSLLRYVGIIISTIAIFIGLIWVAFDPQKQGWHDKIASTYVVKAA